MTRLYCAIGDVVESTLTTSLIDKSKGKAGIYYQGLVCTAGS
ncbi:hypothetical protein PNX04_15240 [[Ruminococcus] gnavus]|nr:hypothetical protein [Mediterraneibacter gnavus]MDB8708336.1 hypothetical protein [Mediterraneibacter gnavus]